MHVRRALQIVITAALVAVTATGCNPAKSTKAKPLATRVISVEYGATGWANSFKPGDVITDGWTAFDLSMGPVRIVSITTTHRGSAADVLGYRIRRVGA